MTENEEILAYVKTSPEKRGKLEIHNSSGPEMVVPIEEKSQAQVCYDMMKYMSSPEALAQMGMVRNVDIKGESYKVTVCDKVERNGELCAGVCDVETKELLYAKSLGEHDIGRVIRHELVHAWFYECGLTEYYSNETLVDWMASQMSKIEETAKAVEEGYRKVVDNSSKKS